MNAWIAPIVMVLGLLLGCGPSAKEIRTARDARYDVSQAQLVDEVRAELEASHGAVDVGEDAATGAVAIVSAGRWYGRDGMARPNKVGDVYDVYDGDIMLALGVTLVRDGERWHVQVIPVVERFRSGHSSRDQLEPGDPRIPGWVQGQVDELQVRLHARLRGFAVAAAPSP
jgi:hypothetical protein